MQLLPDLKTRLTTLKQLQIKAKESYDQLTGAIREVEELIKIIETSAESPVKE